MPGFTPYTRKYKERKENTRKYYHHTTPPHQHIFYIVDAWECLCVSMCVCLYVIVEVVLARTAQIRPPERKG